METRDLVNQARRSLARDQRRKGSTARIAEKQRAIDLLNACRFCGFDKRDGRHFIIGESTISCIVPRDAVPLSFVFVHERETLRTTATVEPSTPERFDVI